MGTLSSMRSLDLLGQILDIQAKDAELRRLRPVHLTTIKTEVRWNRHPIYENSQLELSEHRKEPYSLTPQGVMSLIPPGRNLFHRDESTVQLCL